MRYELMFPEQLERALSENWPAILPIGVLEYHADHLSFGTDGLIPLRMLEKLEKEMDMILFPPFFYGAASYAVEVPERHGTIHIPSETLNLFAKDLFASLLRIGFRNVHCFFAHQSENFMQGMPTDLAFKLGARQAIFAFLEKERGEGWWGCEDSADYYEKHHGKGENPFNWIQIHPLKSPRLQEKWHGDHAGISETSQMLDLCPEGVNMTKPRKRWFTKSADGASLEHGREIDADILADLRKLLKGEPL